MSAGFGRLSRLRIGAQVALALVLAVVGAVLAIDVADWRYVRWDLSASGRNTLDEAVLDLVDNLPEPVQVDVFFRALAKPYETVSLEAQNRMLELLFVAQNARRGEVDVRVHDTDDFEAVQARMRELGVEGVNIIVYSCGERRVTQKLFGEIAVIDWGNPTAAALDYLAKQGIAGVVDPRRWNPDTFRPAQLSIFRGEEVLAQALLKVASGEAPRVYFSSGQGEADPYGTLVTDLSRLRRALESDGFEVLQWDPTEEPAVPADCDVLAIVGPAQPFPPGAVDAVQRYVENGGRVVAAPRFEEVTEGVEGGAAEVLGRFGMHAVPGVVCEAIVGEGGQEVQGYPQCATLFVDERGLNRSLPITEPLVRRGRRVQFSSTLSFDHPQGFAAGGRLLHTLVSTSPEAWRDLPPRYDYAFDRRSEERGRFSLCMLAEVSVPPKEAGAELRKGYALGVASSSFLSDALFPVNRDFLLNAFNYLGEREYRVRVAPLPRGVSRLELSRGAASPVLTYALWLGLPGLCIGIGAVLAWRRRE